MSTPQEHRPIDRLLQVIRRLRDPETGCPWDQQQDFASIAPYTIEEAYEVADAIERGALEELKDELGDLLLQVVFHARMAEEAGLFDFDAVAASIADKMIRRHPHVFADDPAAEAEAVEIGWEAIKARERAAKAAKAGSRASILDDVAKGLPALLRAVKLQKRAARVGFDWTDPGEILDKIEEEIAELRVEIAAGDSKRAHDEMGDLIFALTNLARRLKLDPEAALRHTNTKFERRFRLIEQWLAEEGLNPAQASLEKMEALWQRAKASERDAEG